MKEPPETTTEIEADGQQVRCIEHERRNVLSSLVELSTIRGFRLCENDFTVRLVNYEVMEPWIAADSSDGRRTTAYRKFTAPDLHRVFRTRSLRIFWPSAEPYAR